MSQKRALEHLAACVKKGTNYRWHGQNGLRSLRPGADPKLVERVLKIILPWSAAHCLDRLPDEYAPLAWRILATTTTPEATFLRSYDPAESPAGLRAGSAWLVGAHLIDKANRPRVVALCRDEAGVAAARATVVEHGVAIPQLLAVIAHDGGAESLDAIVEVFDRADRVKDETLDRMLEWFVPYVRGAAMSGFAKELVQARDRRGEASTLHELFARFGVTGKPRIAFTLSIDSRQVQQGFMRKASAHVELATHTLPSIELMITRNLGNMKSTWWEDGKRRCDDNKLGKPSTLEDLPRWLAASGRALRVTWDRETLYVRSSVRGKARQAVIDWLFPAPRP